MIRFQPVVKGAKNLTRGIKTEHRRQKKAFVTAVKVEGFRLMRVLKDQIRKGEVGGSAFAPLSMLARKRRRRTRRLKTAATPVRYYIPTTDPLEMRIGWTGPAVSKSWKRIMEKQQEGFTTRVSGKQRKYLAGYGAELSPRSRFRSYFFLRRTTTEMEVPATPIIEPFWDQQKIRARTNITRNFQAKMRGERI